MQSRWKNVALTVYLICPLALVTGLCVWAMVSLQQRVDKAGETREVPEAVSPESMEGEKNREMGGDGEQPVGGEGTPGNSEEERSESGG